MDNNEDNEDFTSEFEFEDSEIWDDWDEFDEVFKSDEIPRCMCQITDTGGHQLFQRVFDIEWHQVVAQGVIWGMQRHR